MKIVNAFGWVVAAIVGTPVTILSALWIVSLIDPAADQNGCAFGAVSKDQFRQILRRAEAQDWKVWPTLSRGIFWPSDSLIQPPEPDLEKVIAGRLFDWVKELNAPRDTPDRQLAAVHAVMRAMGAEYLRVANIPNFRQNGQLVSSNVMFSYHLPQRRFAPLCLVCIIWPQTTMHAAFHHDLTDGSYTLSRMSVLFGGLKYNPPTTREADTCPMFPSDEPLFRFERPVR